jgi:hypothetical protein
MLFQLLADDGVTANSNLLTKSAASSNSTIFASDSIRQAGE